jgi:nucleotide-binding universal stress UspA family protein
MAVGLPIEDIASATDVMFLLLFVLVNLSVINLRRHRPDLDRGFVVPWLPWTPLLATAINVGLAAFLFFYSPRGMLVSGAYIAAGVLLYYAYARGKERQALVTPVVLSEVPFAEATDYRVLLPLSHPDNCEALVDFAVRIARKREGDIVLLNIIRVPAQLPLSEGRRYLTAARELLTRAAARARAQGVPVHSMVRVAHSVPRAILETAEDKGADLIALGWEGPVRRRDRVFGTVLDVILMNAGIDVALARRVPTRRVRRAIVASAVALPSASSMRLAAALRDPDGEPVTLYHLTTSPAAVDALHERIEEALKTAAEDDPHLDASLFDIVVESHPKSQIVRRLREATEGYELVVMGAPREGLLERAVFGDVQERVAKAIDARIVLTKEPSGPLKSWLQMLVGSRRTSVD